MKLVLAALACRATCSSRTCRERRRRCSRARSRRRSRARRRRAIQCTPDLQPTDVTGPLGLRPAHTRVRVPARADLRQRRPRRRDQPRDAEDAVRAARGDGRAAGDGRRRDAAAPRAVPPARDREPDRARGHVPASRGAARPLLPEDLARLSGRSTTSCGSSTTSATGIRSRRSSPSSPSTEVQELQRAVGDVYVDPLIARWIVDLVRATRELPTVAIGASVRGSLALERAVRAWALLDERDYVTPEDVELLFLPVLAHRVVFTPSVLAEARRDGLGRRVRAASARECRRARAAARARLRGRTAARPQRLSLARLTFPLVPRRRLVGLAFGAMHSARRGTGSRRRRLAPVPAAATTWTRSTGRPRPSSRRPGAPTSSSSASTSPRRRRAS